MFSSKIHGLLSKMLSLKSRLHWRESVLWGLQSFLLLLINQWPDSAESNCLGAWAGYKVSLQKHSPCLLLPLWTSLVEFRNSKLIVGRLLSPSAVSYKLSKLQNNAGCTVRYKKHQHILWVLIIFPAIKFAVLWCCSSNPHGKTEAYEVGFF